MSIQADPEEKISRDDRRLPRVRRPRRAGRAARAARHPVRACAAQPAMDVARGSAARSVGQHHFPLQGGRSAPLPALAGRINPQICESASGNSSSRLHRLTSRCLAAAPSRSSWISRSRWPAWTRPAARRWRGRSSPPPAFSTATNFRAGSTNSKNLPLEKREALYARITKVAAYGVGMASVEEIDSINIYWARMLAMTPRGRGAWDRAGLGAGRRQCLHRNGSARPRRSSTVTPSAARSPPPRSSPRSLATA